MATLSDSQLISAAREGIAEAATMLVNRYAELVHFCVLLHLGTGPRQDEIVAAIFSEMFRQLPHRSTHFQFGYALHMVAARMCARLAMSQQPGDIAVGGTMSDATRLLQLLQSLPNNYQLATVADFLHLTADPVLSFLRMSPEDFHLLSGRGQTVLQEQWTRSQSKESSSDKLTESFAALAWSPAKMAEFSATWHSKKLPSVSENMWLFCRRFLLWGVAGICALFVALWLHLPKSSLIAIAPLFAGMAIALLLALLLGRIIATWRRWRAERQWQVWLRQ
jgi:hypothetical protein